MPSGIGSWRRRGSKGRLADSKPLEVQFTQVGRDSAGHGSVYRRRRGGAESQPRLLTNRPEIRRSHRSLGRFP